MGRTGYDREMVEKFRDNVKNDLVGVVCELKEKIAARETHLATVKQRYLEYKQSQSAPAAAAPASGGFNF